MASLRDLLNIFIANLDDSTAGILSKHVDDHKLGGVANSLEGRAAIERHPGRLEKQDDKNLKVQQKQMHLEFSKSIQKYSQ